ncbi:dihydrodipicolinate reductase [Desulfonatronospira thiodismutans ASO3-1]|uniref:4-hydroxy-tetrahydrodipicolinate reductase n=1 Tax=Desulfonatronospira thiodismutans ASO3-1 TaxID=555779 RepID=D6SLT8_9BACT|nr:4-hydroxy-tetrahydrodipicolinate reductase [Desulfonatronospira thiodismutans]EFI35649.1 dihydrodipicolinate reductase [Desulfonatronospira thiodismutans ASO3-1]
MQTQVIVMGAKGRMGSTISKLAMEDSQLDLVGVVEREDNLDGLDSLSCKVDSDLSRILDSFPGAVVIDFTVPEASMETVEKCSSAGAAAVIGTTGFTAEQSQKLESLAASTRLFWAPNMSVGINVLIQILPELLKSLGEKYDLEIMEIHHKFKKDAPSGTAVKLAQILAETKGLDMDRHGVYARHGIIGERQKDEVGVQTLRGGDVVGEHTFYFLGPGERVEVTHRAHSRETFAQGALRAARWLVEQKPGKLYSMADIFA